MLPDWVDWGEEYGHCRAQLAVTTSDVLKTLATRALRRRTRGACDPDGSAGAGFSARVA
jgi:hypothetical protein